MQQPARAKNMLTIMDAAADWKASRLAFTKAGRTQHSDEDERAQLYKILPSGISQDMLTHAHDQKTAQELIDWMCKKSFFISEHGGKDGEAHVADAPEALPPPAAPLDAWCNLTRRRSDDHDHDHDSDSEIIDEQVVHMNDSELLAFVRNGRRL